MTLQNEPQLSAEMEKRLKKKMAEELHIDWAFKNVHGKPDTIIITGTPKGSYETDYNLFVENMTHFLATALEEQRQQVLSEVVEMVKHEAKMHHEYPMLFAVGKPDNSWNDGYDQALLAVLAKLNQLKGEK